MTRSVAAALAIAALVVIPGQPLGAGQALQGEERLAGIWTINRSLSEFPREMGFNPEWLGAVSPETGSDSGRGASGGRGGRGSRGGGAGSTGGAAGAYVPRESADDAARNRLLTAEVKSPPSRMTIVDVADAITFSDDSGSRTFHPTGRAEAL